MCTSNSIPEVKKRLNFHSVWFCSSYRFLFVIWRSGNMLLFLIVSFVNVVHGWKDCGFFQGMFASSPQKKSAIFLVLLVFCIAIMLGLIFNPLHCKMCGFLVLYSWAITLHVQVALTNLYSIGILYSLQLLGTFSFVLVVFSVVCVYGMCLFAKERNKKLRPFHIPASSIVQKCFVQEKIFVALSFIYLR